MSIFDSSFSGTCLTLAGSLLVIVFTLRKIDRSLKIFARIFITLIDLMRSEPVAWLCRAYRNWAAERDAQCAIWRAKQSRASLTGQHIATSALLYLGFGISVVEFIFLLVLLGLKLLANPQIELLVFMFMTLFAYGCFAGRLKKSADEERRMARHHWRSCVVRDHKAYAAILLSPLALILMTCSFAACYWFILK